MRNKSFLLKTVFGEQSFFGHYCHNCRYCHYRFVERFFGGEVAQFFFEMLSDFVCGEVA